MCLQWEPEIIGMSLMYLATRLAKFEINDWHGKQTGSKLKWWEGLVPDITVELMEGNYRKGELSSRETLFNSFWSGYEHVVYLTRTI